MTARRSSLLLLAAAGVLAGHLLGYGASAGFGAPMSTAHGHLDLLVDVVVPLGAILLVAIALAHPQRSGWGRELTFPRLAGTQSLLYLALEWGERAAQGQGAAELLALPVVAGFVAQLVVALFVVRGVRLSWRFLHQAPLVLGVWVPLVRPTHDAQRVVHPHRTTGEPGARAPPRLVAP
jgi:hypothetical protein